MYSCLPSFQKMNSLSLMERWKDRNHLREVGGDTVAKPYFLEKLLMEPIRSLL